MVMAKGSGSARQAMVITFALLCLLVSCGVIEAATYYVGDTDGWTFNTMDWPSGKTFQAGDVLVFKYVRWLHNLVAVDEDAYNSCSTPPGARAYTSGRDRITLTKGNNYFICSRFGHCQLGMKLVITAV